MTLERTPIICPPRPNRSTKLFGGEASGILNWNDLKHPYFYELREEIRANFWIVAEVDMSAAANEFSFVSDQETILNDLAKLTVHNDAQNALSSAIADYASDPAITSIFATLFDQVMEHNNAFTYALSHIAPNQERQRELLAQAMDPVLQERIDRTNEAKEAITAEPTEANILRGMTQLALVKGVEMYNTLISFYRLAEDGEMKSLAPLIGRVQRDREAQVRFLGELFRVALSESDVDRDALKEEMKRWIEEAVTIEAKDNNTEDAIRFTQYRANRLLQLMGLPTAYPEVDNPLEWTKAYTTFDVEQEASTASDGIDLFGFDDL